MSEIDGICAASAESADRYMFQYVKLVRPAQWVKNLMIFFPPFLGGMLLDSDTLARGTLPFIAFCLASSSTYIVNDILDRLVAEHPRVYGMILYVEQPFPYELEENQIDVHSVSARKPLFMDESAHDWHLIRLGRQLGWTGVALKTCKTQTGALLSLCWARRTA